MVSKIPCRTVKLETIFQNVSRTLLSTITFLELYLVTRDRKFRKIQIFKKISRSFMKLHLQSFTKFRKISHFLRYSRTFLKLKKNHFFGKFSFICFSLWGFINIHNNFQIKISIYIQYPYKTPYPSAVHFYNLISLRINCPRIETFSPISTMVQPISSEYCRHILLF